MFIDEVRMERLAEVDRVAEHVDWRCSSGSTTDRPRHELASSPRPKPAMQRYWHGGSGGERTYVVTHCASAPKLQAPISDPARFPWHEVTKVAHYYLSVNALKHPMEVREDGVSYGTADAP